jgi:hypothetical protein
VVCRGMLGSKNTCDCPSNNLDAVAQAEDGKRYTGTRATHEPSAIGAATGARAQKSGHPKDSDTDTTRPKLPHPHPSPPPYARNVVYLLHHWYRKHLNAHANI